MYNAFFILYFKTHLRNTVKSMNRLLMLCLQEIHNEKYYFFISLLNYLLLKTTFSSYFSLLFNSIPFSFYFLLFKFTFQFCILSETINSETVLYKAALTQFCRLNVCMHVYSCCISLLFCAFSCLDEGKMFRWRDQDERYVTVTSQ